MIILGYILTYLYLLLVLIVSQVLYNKYKVKKIITRKIVHIFIAFVWFIMYYFFKDSIHIIVPPFTFIFLNYLSYKKNIFKSIENKESFGTIYYPISVFIMALLTYIFPNLIGGYAIGLFSMALGDGLAPLIASRFKTIKLINNKTISGSFTVFFVTIMVCLFFNIYLELDYNILTLFIISVCASLIELIGIKGLDNLYLPLGIFLLVTLIEVI